VQTLEQNQAPECRAILATRVSSGMAQDPKLAANNSGLPAPRPPHVPVWRRILKGTVIFFLGCIAGAVAAYFGLGVVGVGVYTPGKVPPQAPPVCYSCFWKGYDPKLRADVISFYNKYTNSDPLPVADARYVVWRASDTPDCNVRDVYRKVADDDSDVFRRLTARAIRGFGGPECGQDGLKDLKAAAGLARKAGLTMEADTLRQIASGDFKPRFDDVNIQSSIAVPAGAKTLILGESTIELTKGLRVGTQVDRVARDWISYQMRWDLTGNPFPPLFILDYHEGAFVKQIQDASPVEIYPLTGSIIAAAEQKWYAPDETGTFRFEILKDKTEYPTTHTFGSVGWIEDTHGISALVPQALERGMKLVIGCGDAEGKAKAAFYLAQKGVNVVIPGDRYQDLLIGYQAPGIVLGTAPVKKVDGKTVIGHQPVKFSFQEPIVVEDTRQIFPIQYYDSGARYFRRLSQFVPLHPEYVQVDDSNQIERVLERAQQIKATAVAVRVFTNLESEALRAWLASSPEHRAILFHSGLYPYAQRLFAEFPQQVTFGDLHPKFE
jgi:hypothetical protein